MTMSEIPSESAPRPRPSSSPRFLRAARQFWKWFGDEHQRLSEMLRNHDTEGILAAVGPRMAMLHESISEVQHWEIGPGIRKQAALSFQLVKLENIPIIQAFVDMSPAEVLANWEINAGRPPKIWSGTFEFQDLFTLDTNMWRYVLTSYQDGAFYDIEINASSWPAAMTSEERLSAAWLALEFYLGERVLLEKIGHVEVLKSLTTAQRKRFSALPDLPDHLKHIQKKT
ncbi:MAG: hypothetical protein ACAI35_27465 [Candidatus Methylacidiphilales bacterium]